MTHAHLPADVRNTIHIGVVEKFQNLFSLMTTVLAEVCRVTRSGLPGSPAAIAQMSHRGGHTAKAAHTRAAAPPDSSSDSAFESDGELDHEGPPPTVRAQIAGLASRCESGKAGSSACTACSLASKWAL